MKFKLKIDKVIVINMVVIGFTILMLFNYIAESSVLEHIEDNGEWIPIDTIDIDYYWKRRDSVYWDNQLVEFRKYTPAIKEADVNSFVICKGEFYSKDKNHVYYPFYQFDLMLDDRVGRDVSEVRIIKDANPKTFKVIGEGFAVDGSKMYFMGENIPYNKGYLNKEARIRTKKEYTILPD